MSKVIRFKSGYRGGDTPSPGPTPPGPTPSVPEKDVNLYDYDGSVVASYTTEEFAALTSLPNPPEHEFLTFQGWNWTLEQAKAYVSKYKELSIGTEYRVTDGKTRIFISLVGRNNKVYSEFYLMGTVTIDWGDGSEPMIVQWNNPNKTVKNEHTYEESGDYIISLEVEGTLSLYGTSTYTYLLHGSAGYPTYAQAAVTKVLCGDSLELKAYAFRALINMTEVVIPSYITQLNADLFKECYALKNISLPHSITIVHYGIVEGCHTLKRIQFGPAIESGIRLYNDSSLQTVSIPESVTQIIAVYVCYSIRKLVLPDTITQITNYGLYVTPSLELWCYALQPPTLGAYCTGAKVIYVPEESVEAYKAATNWSAQASKILPMPTN